MHLVKITAILIVAFNTVATAKDNVVFDKSNIEFTSVELKTSNYKGKSSFDDNLKFELNISHPDYNIISLNKDKSNIKGIYTYSKPPKNLLAEVRKKEKDNSSSRMCFGSSCGAEKLDYSSNKGGLKVSYRNKKIQFDSLRVLWVKADLYVKLAPKSIEVEEAIIENVKISKRGTKEIVKENVKFVLKNNGSSSSSSSSGRKYGFDVIAKGSKAVKNIQIADDSGNYEALKKYNSRGKESYWINEKYVDKPVSLKVNYYELQEELVKVSQFLISK